MSTIEQQLQKVKQEGRIGLMTHVVVGYPGFEETISIIQTMAKHGVDFIELQIPFSDPLADGPTIMRACEYALEQGTKVKDAFTVMKAASSEVAIPLLFMAYYNTVFRYGIDAFCRDAKEAGAAGLIVPDMPLDEEEEEHFFAAAKKYELHTIQVISLASTEKRLILNAKAANGFVYCTARQGITGAKDSLDPKLTGYLEHIRPFFTVPIAVGFGISRKEHVTLLKPYADIAVIGSAIIDIINRSDKSTMPAKVAQFIQSLQ